LTRRSGVYECRLPGIGLAILREEENHEREVCPDSSDSQEFSAETCGVSGLFSE